MSEPEKLLEDLKQLYTRVTGGDPNDVPHSPIPPETSPEEHVHNSMQQLQQLLGTLGPAVFAGETPTRTPPAWPRLNVRETTECWSCEIELPGVKKEDLKVNVSEGTLHLRASQQPRTEPGQWRPVHIEAFPCDYDRHVPLPPTVNGKTAAARLEDGLLRVQFEKFPATGPEQRQVPVD